MISLWYFGSDLPTWALFAELTVAGAMVVLLASRLTGLADELADRYNLGRAWVGMLLLATVTSLPEVVTGGTAVAIHNPNLAFATLMGSCSFNIVLIVMINAVMGGGSVLGRATGSHTLTSAFGVILIAFTLIGVTLVRKFEDQLRFAQACEWICVLAIAGCYIWFIRLTYRFDHADREHTPPLADEAGDVVEQAVAHKPGLGGKITFISALLVVAAWWLTRTGDVLAEHPIGFLGRPLGASFVGAAFLALATSLPEVATCLAAIKIGHLDLALGNIFGSNMFNMFVLPMIKLVSVGAGAPLLMGGPNFDAVQVTITGLLPVLLTGIVVASLTYRSQRRFLRLGYDSILLALVYAAGMYVVFRT